MTDPDVPVSEEDRREAEQFFKDHRDLIAFTSHVAAESMAALHLSGLLLRHRIRAVEQERERCARIVEDPEHWNSVGGASMSERIASAIRSRAREESQHE